jgi:hypothetical protein
LPFFFYANIGLSFLHQEVTGDIVSQVYPYDLVPLFAVITLTFLEVATLVDKKKQFNFSRSNRFSWVWN